MFITPSLEDKEFQHCENRKNAAEKKELKVVVGTDEKGMRSEAANYETRLKGK